MPHLRKDKRKIKKNRLVHFTNPILSVNYVIKVFWRCKILNKWSLKVARWVPVLIMLGNIDISTRTVKTCNSGLLRHRQPNFYTIVGFYTVLKFHGHIDHLGCVH